MTRISLLMTLVFLSACSTPLSIHVPQGRFDLPENVGEDVISFSLSSTNSGYNISLSPDIAVFPVDTQNPTISTGSEIYEILPNILLDIGWGITKRVEIGASVAKGTGLYIKTQLLGRPQNEAKKRNFSLAVNLTGIQHEQSASESGASYDYKAIEWDAGLIAGYRIRDNMLLFGSVFQSQSDFSGGVTGGLFPGPYSGQHRQQGLTLGMHADVTKKLFVELEFIQSQIEVGQSSRSSNFTGFRVGYKW